MIDDINGDLNRLLKMLIRLPDVRFHCGNKSMDCKKHIKRADNE